MSKKYNLARLVARRDEVSLWLAERAPDINEEQRHLDAQSTEQAYWHFGYQSALTDIIDALVAAEQRTGSAGKPN